MNLKLLPEIPLPWGLVGREPDSEPENLGSGPVSFCAVLGELPRVNLSHSGAQSSAGLLQLVHRGWQCGHAHLQVLLGGAGCRPSGSVHTRCAVPLTGLNRAVPTATVGAGASMMGVRVTGCAVLMAECGYQASRR